MERQIEKSTKLNSKMIALMAAASEKDGKIPFFNILKKLRRSLKWQKFITRKNAA